MIIKTPHAVIEFCQMFNELMTVRQRRIIPRIIISILMSCGNPNFSVISGKILSEKRNRSSIARFFASIKFNPAMLLFATLRVFLSIRTKIQNRGTWFLILDGTATRRGGFTKIENATKYREKKENRKGGHPSTKAHMFLMGILIAPDGTRYPLPALPYYTKEYCKKNQRKFLTQVELAAQMIREAPIPTGVQKLVVLADEYYEGATLHKACREKGYSYIVPSDSRRCLADEQGHRTAVTLYRRGLQLLQRSNSPFRKIVLVEGLDKTTPYRRLSEPGRKTKRVYRAHSEDAAVAGLGPVRVTYSMKRKNKKGQKSSGETYKVLISNDMTLPVEEIVEYYELRWQIELFFRELKSVIGFHKFRGNSFTSFARFVSIVLLSFLFLEWMRCVYTGKAKSKLMRATFARARTHGLVNFIQKDIDEENLEYILACLRDVNGQEEGIAVLKNMLLSA
jgi:hypothetical protein